MCIFNLGPRAVNMLRAPRYLNPAVGRQGIGEGVSVNLYKVEASTDP